MKITFLGAAGTVTGSRYLIESEGRKLLVDCGLFQGLKDLRERNWAELTFEADELDAVLLTHAHIDHSGYLPRLMKAGFSGPIYCSRGTFDLCRILLPDSGRLQEEDADSANRHGYSRHQPALPLYTAEDAKEVLKQFQPIDLGAKHELWDEMSFTFHHAGHILGASFVMIKAGQTSLLFSGDLGRMNDPVMCAPAVMRDADYLVLESTYGDKLHSAEDPGLALAAAINRTIARGGTVVVPAFAVGRAQTLLYYIHRLKHEGMIPPELPVYLDSPMAIDASDMLSRHMSDHRLSRAQCASICGEVKYVHSSEESKALNGGGIDIPKIIISASGMATGGRVLHHLKYFMPHHRNTVLLVGYQAEGTRGAQLMRGASEIKIHGAAWPVNAEVVYIDGLSAHADYQEMMDWLRGFNRPPRQTFITHGEPKASESLKEKIEAAYGWNATVVKHGQQFEL